MTEDSVSLVFRDQLESVDEIPDFTAFATSALSLSLRAWHAMVSLA